MKHATKRAILRSIHLLFGIPILGYVYSPFDQIPNYAPAVRWFFLPALALSGFWMWKGFSKRPPQLEAIGASESVVRVK